MVSYQSALLALCLESPGLGRCAHASDAGRADMRTPLPSRHRPVTAVRIADQR